MESESRGNTEPRVVSLTGPLGLMAVMREKETIVDSSTWAPISYATGLLLRYIIGGEHRSK